jgi:hypothetical protein
VASLAGALQACTLQITTTQQQSIRHTQRDDAPVDAGDGYGHDGQAFSVLAEEGVSDALLAAIELDNCLLRHLGTS